MTGCGGLAGIAASACGGLAMTEVRGRAGIAASACGGLAMTGCGGLAGMRRGRRRGAVNRGIIGAGTRAGVTQW